LPGAAKAGILSRFRNCENVKETAEGHTPRLLAESWNRFGKVPERDDARINRPLGFDKKVSEIIAQENLNSER